MYPWIKSQAKYILIYLSRGKERKQTSNIFAKENEPVLPISEIHKRLTPRVEKESVLNICSAGCVSLTLVNFPPCDFDHFTPYFGQFSPLRLTLLPPVK